MRSGGLVTRVVLLVCVLAALVGALYGSGVFGGRSTAEAAGGWLGADSTPIAPASGAFRIWSVIYLGLLCYAIWRLFAGGRRSPRVAACDSWVAVSAVLNAAWIWVVQLDLLAVSVAVIVALLGVLIGIFRVLVRPRPHSVAEAVLLDGTMGLYLGWVCIAVVANIAAWLGSVGVRGPEVPVASALIVTATAVGIALAVFGRGRFAPSIAIAWALCWIAAGRSQGNFESPVLVTLALAGAALTLVVTAVARLLRRRSLARS